MSINKLESEIGLSLKFNLTSVLKRFKYLRKIKDLEGATYKVSRVLGLKDYNDILISLDLIVNYVPRLTIPILELEYGDYLCIKLGLDGTLDGYYIFNQDLAYESETEGFYLISNSLDVLLRRSEN